jgi:TolB-like protein
VAVTDFVAQCEVAAAVLASLTEVAATEIEKAGAYRAVSGEDLRGLLAHQADVQALGTADPAALARIGVSAGAAQIVGGTIGRVGDVYTVVITWIDAQNARVVARASARHSGDESGLVPAVHTAMADLLRQTAGNVTTGQPAAVSIKQEAAASTNKIKIAVMDVAAKQGVSPQAAASLTDLATAEIAQLGRYEVISRDDIRVMLEHLANQQLVQCDDTRCLAVIGGALGVDYIFAGNVGMVGNLYIINLKVIDINQATVRSRVTAEYRGPEAGLVGQTKQGIDKLFDEGRLFRQKMAKWGVVGASALAAGTGGYFAWRGSDIYSNEYLKYADPGDPGVGHNQALQLKSDVEKMDLYRNVSLAVTGALSGLAYYLFKIW